MSTLGQSTIEIAIRKMGQAPLNESIINTYIRPLFSKTLKNTSAIYLANHSLGRILDQTEIDVLDVLHYWSLANEDVLGYWLVEMEKFRQQTAKLICAYSADSIIPKTSAGQGLRAILNCYQNPIRVLCSKDEFNSIDYIVKVFAQKKRIQLEFIRPSCKSSNHYLTYHDNDLLNALKLKPDLVVISMVFFTSGQWLKHLKQLIAKAHQQGTLVLLDLYHAVGVVPVNVNDLDVDFAIGGSYKYLRGGPGAAWLYIHPRHLDGNMKTLDTGWFAQDQCFSYQRPEQLKCAKGGNAFLESTPAIMPLYQARAGLQFTLNLGVQRIRDYSLKQQQQIESLLQQHNIPFLGKAEDRGAFIAIPHQQAENLVIQLKAVDVICDARENLLRLCPDLLNTEKEIAIAIEKLSLIWKDIT